MGGKVAHIINRGRIEPSTGTAGLKTQVYGACATVSGVANASGGIGGGRLIKTDVK